MGRIKKTILITGANGYIGKNLCEQLPQNYNLLTPSRKEFDLLNQRQVNNFFDSHSVDTVIHCALVGGSRREENTSGALLENMRAFFNLTGNKKNFER